MKGGTTLYLYSITILRPNYIIIMEKKERLAFIEGMKECMQNLSFKGRSRRSEFWWYTPGIWHGLFFIPNLVKSWFGDTLFKAESYTLAYNVWWWIVVVLQGVLILFGRE